ncbi:MAG: Calx-beta domain-containing protein, partial [Pseudomonadota bacterium]
MARLAFDAVIEPVTSFLLGECGFNQDIAFQADGKMILARTSNDSASGQIIINRIDLPAEIEINAVSVLEGDPAQRQQNIAVVDVSLTRPHPAGDDIEVSYFTRDSTALVGLDYTLAQGTLTFSGLLGETTQSFQVPIIGDLNFEDDEIFEVNLEGEVNAVLRNESDSANVTIIDDDTTPDIIANCIGGNANDCQTIQEPGISGTSSTLLVSLIMLEAVDSDVSVNFETVDGTAVAGLDYLANSGTLQFPAGSTIAQFAVTIIGDDISEDTETFTVELSGADSVSLPDTTLTFRILNETLCELDLDPDPNDVVVTSAGGSESFTVNTSLFDCDWEVVAEDIGDGTDWITLNTLNGTGSGSVNFDVAPFDPPAGSPLARNVNINVSLSASNDPFVAQTVTFAVGQDGDCTFITDANFASFDVDGGTGSFQVTPNDESCEWSATSDDDWVTITSPLTIATGTGSVSYSVADNAGETNVENPARSMTIISEEFTYSIDQNGCTYALDSNTVNVEASDSSASVDVFAPTSATGECAWTAVSNASWILISDGASGSGGGSVSLAILDNPSVDPRSGTVAIGDETLTVNQSGQECDFTVSPVNFSISPDGDDFDVEITGTDGCGWQLEPQEAWITITTNSSGSGSETSSGSVAINLSESDRTASVLLRSTIDNSTPATITFAQDGFLIYEPF